MKSGAYVYPRDLPVWMQGAARRVGFRYLERGRRWLMRTSWAEVSGGWGLACNFIQWGDSENGHGPSIHIRPGYGNFYFHLPERFNRPVDDDMTQWGFSWTAASDLSDSVHLHWGARTKLVPMPWQWARHSHEVRRADGSWVQAVQGNYQPPYSDGRAVTLHPYTYRFRSGEVQHRTATVYLQRRTWRLRIAPWLPWPRLVRTSIDVSFDDELGERAGSWKGGCIACSHDMRPGETPEQTLRRMEAERRFA